MTASPSLVHPDVLELAGLLRPEWAGMLHALRASGEPLNDGDAAVMARVRQLNQTITTDRQAAGEAWATFETARETLAASDRATDRSSPEFQAAEAASSAYEEIAARLRGSEETRDALLSMTSSGPANGNGNGPQDGDVDGAVQALTSSPGVLLATMLERRKRDVPTLPEQLRMQAAAMTTPATTENISTTVESDAVIDLLSPQSVALASGIPVLRIDGTKTRVPRFTDLPVAGWIPELGAFPKSGPGVEMVDSEPPKVGLVTELSLEVFEDLRPLTLAMLQVQLLRAVALAFDAGILFGDGTGSTPRGVANTPGIAAITGVPLTNLGAFAQALAFLIGENARPGALVMNPMDVGTLLQLTESNDGTGSNVPLWKASIGSASGLRLPYFNTPIWPTPAAPAGRALLYDPATILAVLRREADIAIDPYYEFDNGIVGLRTYLRGDVVVGQPDGAVVIEFGTAATASASTDVITSAGHGLIDGNKIVFSNLAGGAPLTAGTTYYVRDVSGSTFKVAATLGGAAIDITSNMTAGTVRRVA